MTCTRPRLTIARRNIGLASCRVALNARHSEYRKEGVAGFRLVPSMSVANRAALVSVEKVG
jgi:hypothetical protein